MSSSLRSGIERRRAVLALGQRALDYYVDTGECVFCGADDLAHQPHDEDCDVGVLSGVELTEERRRAKARERALAAQFFEGTRMQTHNPMCDGSHCRSSLGEVRVLPIGGGANLIVCPACHEHELGWRRQRNHELGRPAFLLPAWDTLEVYDGAL